MAYVSFAPVLVQSFRRVKSWFEDDRTLPIWFFNELFRPRERPVTNVVAVIVMVVTLAPILAAYHLTKSPDEKRDEKT